MHGIALAFDKGYKILVHSLRSWGIEAIIPVVSAIVSWFNML